MKKQFYIQTDARLETFNLLRSKQRFSFQIEIGNARLLQLQFKSRLQVKSLDKDLHYFASTDPHREKILEYIDIRNGSSIGKIPIDFTGLRASVERSSRNNAKERSMRSSWKFSSAVFLPPLFFLLYLYIVLVRFLSIYILAIDLLGISFSISIVILICDLNFSTERKRASSPHRPVTCCKRGTRLVLKGLLARRRRTYTGSNLSCTSTRVIYQVT